MTLRLRFLLSLLAVLALMAVPAFYAGGRVTELRDIVLTLRGQSARSALAVGRLEAALTHIDRFQRLYVITADPEFAVRLDNAMAGARAEAEVLRDAGHGDITARVAHYLDELAGANARVEMLVSQEQLDAASEYLLGEAVPLVDSARAALPGLARAIDERTSATVPLAQRSAMAAGTASRVALLVALALAVVLALAAARVLTQPLDDLRLAMARVADGAFRTPADLPYDRQDEIGDLSRSFRTMTLRLAELDRLKAEFVGAASHELKTPISVIAGYAELLDEEANGALGSRPRELIHALAEQTVALQRRVDQLLELSRIESGRLRLGLEEINLRHFFNEVHRAFEPAAIAQHIDLQFSVHDSTPPFLIADPDVMRSDVLGNLIGNALRFTPPGGTIRVSVRADGDRLGLEVADTGRGIPHDQLDHIFDRYYQGRGARGGSGLGLAIARAGVEAHGGRIDVHSREGRGTRFRVTLPVRATFVDDDVVSSEARPPTADLH